MFPDKGKYSREQYQKHLDFFKAGAYHSRRCFIAANRIGKTNAGAYEFVCHATGLYPHWWIGKRFTKPINAWVCALTGAQLREAVQEILFGSLVDLGTGMIPRHTLLDEKGNFQTTAMPGGGGAIQTCYINHVTGGKSKVEFKTYEMGWEKYQGAKRDLIWLDEEPGDPKIYDECTTRTAADNGKEGILYMTFTPLKGYSKVVEGFLPNGKIPENGINPKNPQKFAICATWDDVPHLSEAWKQQQLADYSPNEREARSKGIVSMGSGSIYPIDEDMVIVSPFEIPEYWPRAYGYDFGYHATAAVWTAQDPVTKIKYIYSEYKQGKVADYVHAQNIKTKGDWIPGIADPSGGGRRDDGTLKIDYMRSLGLKLIPGYNAINTGIGKILNQFESGLLKIFRTCEKLRDELRVYRYDINNPNNPARNQEDHLLDAMRYCDSRFEEVAISEQANDEFHLPYYDEPNKTSRDDLTGY